MNVKLFTTKDYKNEPPSGSKKTNPIQTQSKPVLSAVEWADFRQEMLKNALSTCLRKAPLRRHRQSYSTWNLLFRPDRRPPHLQPATDTLRNRSAYTINTASYPVPPPAFRLFLISSVSLRPHSGHLSGKSLGTVPLRKTIPQSGFIHFSALKTLGSPHFSQIIGGALGAIGLACSSTYLKYPFLLVWYSALQAGLLHLTQIISSSEMLSMVPPPPPCLLQVIIPATAKHNTITPIIIGFFLLSSISISPKQLNYNSVKILHLQIITSFIICQMLIIYFIGRLSYYYKVFRQSFPCHSRGGGNPVMKRSEAKHQSKLLSKNLFKVP